MTGPLVPLRQKLLDGRYRWGRTSRRRGRYGTETIRLVIHPPIATQAQLRMARLSRFWPGISVGLITIVTPALVALTNLSAYFIIGCTLILAIMLGITLARMTAPLTAQSVELFVSASFLSPSEDARDNYDYVAKIVEDLHEAEQYLNLGQIPWRRYRELWAENYEIARRGIPQTF